jgi:plastocyanin
MTADLTAPTTDRTIDLDPPRDGATDIGSWDRTLAILAAIVAVADLAIQPLTGLIPPLLAFGLLGLAGVAVLPRRPKVGRIGLLVVSLLGTAGGAPFALAGLAHPESPIDFVHGVTSLPLRVVVLVAAVAALRGASTGARRTRAVALASLGGLVVVAVASSFLVGSSVVADPGDVVLRTEGAVFVDGDQLAVATGERLVVDNADPFRHTFTIEDAGVDVEIPAGRTVEVPLDLQPGTYDYICAVPGHEAMTGTLVVGA